MAIATQQHAIPGPSAGPNDSQGTGTGGAVVPAGPKVGVSVLVAQAPGAEPLAADLDGAGFEVVVVTGPQTALRAAEATLAGIALVDWRFDGDGLSWCRQLWAQCPGYPVLFVGPNDENLIANALTSGVDDYIRRPLRQAELVARVRAVLRRAPRRRAEANRGEGVLVVGDVVLSTSSHEVTLRSVPVHLPLREFQLLKLLMENVGIVLTRTTLVARLWGPSVPVDHTSLDVHIRRLRAKLEDDPGAPKRITTVRGIGYRYRADR